MRRKLAVLFTSWFVAGAIVGVVSPTLATSATYSVDDLGTLPGDYASVAMGINQYGDVVGWSLGRPGRALSSSPMRLA